MNPGTQRGFGGLSVGAGLGFGNALFFCKSGNYTIPADGWYRLSAVGGGGAGGLAASPVGTACLNAAGGAGGSFGESILYLRAGEVLQIVVGSGGTAAAATVSTGNPAGVTGGNGGASRIIYSGGRLLAPGGAGGAGVYSVAAATALASGGVCVRPSGWQINAAGGDGGAAYWVSGATSYSAGGGGAAGSPLGDGGKGGNAANGLSTSLSPAGGGAIGGGVGGDAVGTRGAGAGVGGSAVTTTLGPNAFGYPRGVGAGGGAPYAGKYAHSSFGELRDPFRSLTGGGGAAPNALAAPGTAHQISVPGPGGGSPGLQVSGASGANADTLIGLDGAAISITLNSSFMGGGGGVCTYGVSGVNARTYQQQFVGAGGGGHSAVAGSGTATTYNGTSGGNGLVTIERVG